MVVFYCDLARQTSPPAALPSTLRIVRLRSESELDPQHLKEMTSFWNPKQSTRDIKERFEKGASLWLIICSESLAGYSWTIQGRTISSYYFPLTQDDVQIFDWYVFPKYRGRAIHWFLITHILYELGSEGASRAYGDVAEWNRASLSSYKLLTPFRMLGLVRSFTIFGHTFVFWVHDETPDRK
jgi:hypothetical protein